MPTSRRSTMASVIFGLLRQRGGVVAYDRLLRQALCFNAGVGLPLCSRGGHYRPQATMAASRNLGVRHSPAVATIVWNDRATSTVEP